MTEKIFITKNLKPSWYLLIGIVVLSMAHVTYGIDLLAWIASVPFLLYLSKTKGLGSRILFSMAFIVAWSVAIFKIVTDPIPIFLLVLYSIPIGLIQLPGYLVWARVKSPQLRMLIFPVIMVMMEWLQYTLTPFASWGSAAYTQVDSPAITQSVSLFGLAGLSFLIYWLNASFVEAIIGKTYKYIVIPLLALTLVVIWGGLRLDNSRSMAVDTITVAAVGTDSDISGLPLPSLEKNELDIQCIFERTRKASVHGAELVVWNEAAFYLLPEYEQAWKDSIRMLAKEQNLSIIASYVVPLEGSSFRYYNKYIFVQPDGSIHHEYHKHKPVPGEPAVQGVAPQTVVPVGESLVGAAICYDYDYPYVGRDNRNAGADIVGLPSSDWRGIDPIHTQMASFRAIEQGYSIIRSTRFGLSAAITPYGVMQTQMSSFNENSKIMISQLPSKSIPTLYSMVGDLLVWMCITFLFCVLVKQTHLHIRRRSNKPNLLSHT